MCDGCFYVVSNGGEITVVQSEGAAPFCTTSMGDINDLDQFAALARDNWAEV